MTELIPTAPSRPLPIETCLQNIASAAWARGVVTIRSGVVGPEVPPADLMRALRGAWTKATTARRDQVENIIRTVAQRLRRDGPVQVPKSVLGICTAYAGLTRKKAEQRKRLADARKKRRVA